MKYLVLAMFDLQPCAGGVARESSATTGNTAIATAYKHLAVHVIQFDWLDARVPLS